MLSTDPCHNPTLSLSQTRPTPSSLNKKDQEKSSRAYDVGIIGGGIIGLAVVRVSLLVNHCLPLRWSQYVMFSSSLL